MISQLPFLRLLQAATALLLFAAVPAGADGPRGQAAIAELAQAASKRAAFDDRAQERQPDPAIATAHLDIDDEKGLDSGPKPQLGPDFVPRAPRVAAHASQCAAVPTHRSCAAPPTGPPHA